VSKEFSFCIYLYRLPGNSAAVILQEPQDPFELIKVDEMDQKDPVYVSLTGSYIIYPGYLSRRQLRSLKQRQTAISAASLTSRHLLAWHVLPAPGPPLH
jgi:hypothetical protein